MANSRERLITVNDNRTVITGVIVKGPKTRVTPAGIPITRFVVEHQSRQTEAGLEREIRCRVPVVAAGVELSERLKKTPVDRPVTVSGFLNQTPFWGQEKQLVLHALSVE